MYKVATIGKQKDVLGFLALGFKVNTVNKIEEAKAALHALADSKEYAVIFIAEDFAEALKNDIAQYNDDLIPSIVTIPSSSADNGYGMDLITEAVKSAVGADIK